jgi:hypothetical protein
MTTGRFEIVGRLLTPILLMMFTVISTSPASPDRTWMRVRFVGKAKDQTYSGDDACVLVA